jgi:hypothetical protein
MTARLPYLERAAAPPEVQRAANFTNRFNAALGTEIGP